MAIKLKKETYIVSLKENNLNAGTYRVNKTLFQLIKKQVAPYKSEQIKPRKVKCIETGKVFESASKASDWVRFVNELYNCDANLIKQACRGKQKTSYGYHWEFVIDNEKDEDLK